MTNAEYIKALEHAISHDGRSGKPVDRFWSKVDKNGPVPAHMPRLGPCWVWTGSTRNGYGQIGTYTVAKNHQPKSAHILSYELVHGKVPEGKHVCHSCDNPPCVNPSHLWTGTARQNLRDAQAKGRMRVRKPDTRQRITRVRVTPEQQQILKAARLARDLNVYQMGDMLGWDFSRYYRFETDEPSCRVEQLHFLLRFFSIDENEFDLKPEQTYVRGIVGRQAGKKRTSTKWISVYKQTTVNKSRHHILWDRLNPCLDHYRADLLIEALKSKGVQLLRMCEEVGVYYGSFRKIVRGLAARGKDHNVHLPKIVEYAGLTMEQITVSQQKLAA
jgi:hypothetical protein